MQGQAQGVAEKRLGGASAGADSDSDTKSQAQMKPDEGGSSASGKTRTEGQAKADSDNQQTKQGARDSADKAGSSSDRNKAEANAKSESKSSAKLEQKQVTEIKQYFSSHKPNVKRVQTTEVNVSVGVAVPGSVTLYPLPSTIVVAESSSCPFEYFVWGDDIVIVDSCTRVAVEIITGVV
jgi:hypothetical protein